jgi:two-component system sensor histidine kinase FlrB
MALALQTMSLWVVAIADNIRNPVAGMGAALEVLRHQLELKDAAPPTGTQHDPAILKHALDKIQHRLASLNEYVTELVDFAKAPTLYRDLADLDEVIKELEREIVDFYPFPIEVIIAPDPHTPKPASEVSFDRVRVKACLKAILINGVDAACVVTSFAKAQVVPKVRLEISRDRHQGGRERLVFAVEDNGTGFTPESQQKAFEAFFSTKEAGTGLGLYLVKKYILAHGGEVSIETPRHLGGARVVFWIPIESTEKSKRSGEAT